MDLKESPTFRGVPKELKLQNIPENKYSLSDASQLSPTFAADARKDTAFFG